MTNQLELFNEKLESYQTNLIQKIEQKLIQTQEVTKLALKILPESINASNAMPLNEFLAKFNQFLNANTDITQQITAQFCSFCCLENGYEI
jgi:hydrogenase-4 membrane subunit HyfE